MSFRLLLLILLLSPLAVWAAQKPLRGIDSYARGNYSKAITELSREVDNPKRSEKERGRARLYLAASLYASGNTDEAGEQLKELARRYPEQRVDPKYFPPDFVAFAEQQRKDLEAAQLAAQAAAQKAEQERLAAEAERLAAEAERRKREQEAQLRLARVPDEEPQVTASEEEAPSIFRLRPELTGYSDAAGVISGGKVSFGGALGLTVGGGPLEGTVRALAGGERWAWELETGCVFGTGVFQPRLAARATLFPRVGERTADNPSRARFGVGGAVGGRLAVSRQLTLLADVGGEVLVDAAQRYNGGVFVISAGVGYNLF